MASVFLSYDRDDRAKAAEIAAALEKGGHQVWWDERLRGGAQYSKEIQQALDDSDAVVVLWSKSSIESAWVRDEAAEGRDRDKLIPVSIDSAKPPIGFRQFHTIDATNSARGKQGIDQLLQSVGESASRPASPSANSTAAAGPSPPRVRRLAIIAGSVFLVVAAAVALFFSLGPFPSSQAGEVSAAVSPLDSSAESKALSNDLVAKLAGYSSAQGASLRLVDGSKASSAAFIFQVGGSNEQDQARASLLLIDGRSSAVLWSEQFERPASGIGDLRQQMGYTGSQVLECALDAYRSRQLVSQLDALKSYLDGCATYAASDPRIPRLRLSSSGKY